MKKNIFICALCAIFAFGFTSCKDNTDDMTESEKRAEFLVGARNGWVLSTATSDPAYINSGGASSTNLFDVYLLECELDDRLIFKADKSQAINRGTNKCDADELREEALGVWGFVGDDGTRLNMQIPFFNDADVEQVTVRVLNSDEFRYNYVYIEEETSRRYTFTLTYTK